MSVIGMCVVGVAVAGLVTGVITVICISVTRSKQKKRAAESETERTVDDVGNVQDVPEIAVFYGMREGSCAERCPFCDCEIKKQLTRCEVCGGAL